MRGDAPENRPGGHPSAEGARGIGTPGDGWPCPACGATVSAAPDAAGTRVCASCGVRFRPGGSGALAAIARGGGASVGRGPRGLLLVGRLVVLLVLVALAMALALRRRGGRAPAHERFQMFPVGSAERIAPH
jgi:hypothetical protein